jgi:hypothetical protein
MGSCGPRGKRCEAFGGAPERNRDQEPTDARTSCQAPPRRRRNLHYFLAATSIISWLRPR